MEIERKFLLKEVPANLENYESHEIEQAYISTTPVVRVRRTNDRYELTVKASGMLSHEEFELPLTKSEYLELLKKTTGNIITKTRYVIPAENDLKIELDVFHGRFEGFIMAEVEFSSEEDAVNYTPPAFFGKDVTYDKTYYNASLSNMSGREIQLFLDELE